MSILGNQDVCFLPVGSSVKMDLLANTLLCKLIELKYYLVATYRRKK